MEYYLTLERHVPMQRQGGNLNAYYWAKEANLKQLHTIWVQLYEILEKAKPYEDSKKKKNQWFPEIGKLILKKSKETNLAIIITTSWAPMMGSHHFRQVKCIKLI